MAHTTYVDGSTPTVDAAWLNDVDKLAYTWFGNGTSLNNPTKLQVTQGVFSTSVVTNTLKLGATPGFNGTINLSYQNAIVSLNQGGFGDVGLIALGTINGITDIVQVGIFGGGSNGVVLQGRSGAGAPTTTDLSTSKWAVWKDTTAVATKVYYNDGGTIRATAPFDGIVTKYKPANETRTSTITLADDADLKFAIAANEIWVARFMIDCGSLLTTSGAQVAVTTPAGATLNVTAVASSYALTSNTNRTTSSGTGLNFLAGSFQTADPCQLIIETWVQNGGTPGNITLQFAQQTSSVSALTFRKGSYMHATRIA